MSLIVLTLCFLTSLSMAEIDYEREYSPHYWTKRKNAETVLDDYIKAITEISERTRENVPYEPEVEYGKGERQRIDIYGKDSIPPNAPILVYIHGGYWQLLSKNISAQIVHPLWKKGVRVFVAGYDLAPQASVGDIIRETKELASFVMDYAIKNKVRKVWICGHSAGAHLAASLLDGEWLPLGGGELFRGLVLVSGVYDLKPIVTTSFNKKLGLTEHLAEKWSPMSLKKGNLPLHENFTVIIYVGEHESPEFIRQSRDYYLVLKKQGINSEFHLLSGLDHFDIASNLQYEDFILTKNIMKLF